MAKVATVVKGVIPGQVSTFKKFATFTVAVIVALGTIRVGSYLLDKYTRAWVSRMKVRAELGAYNLIDKLPGGLAPAAAVSPAEVAPEEVGIPGMVTVEDTHEQL